MSSSLTLTNYRGFEHYRISEVNQINLLVGKNNCGKSSILEGVHLLSTRGHPFELQRICIRRGEVIEIRPGEPNESINVPDVSHFFYGHTISLGSELRIDGNDLLGTISITPTESPKQESLFEFEDAPSLALRIFQSNLNKGTEGHIPIRSDGALLMRASEGIYTRKEAFNRGDRKCIYIDIDTLNNFTLRDLWDNIQLNTKEKEVEKALRIIDPTLNKLVFLSSVKPFRGISPSRSGILIDRSDDERRIPLGSYGEGLRRILSLAISLIDCEGGVLLIDEIDTGLHYSVMGELWKFIVENASRYNVKVFATTHSYDCIRGLSWYCKNYPDSGNSISLHKIDRRLDEAVTMKGEEISIAHDSNIEVR